MRYDPSDANQKCLRPGDYEAVIENAIETQSKSSGSDMIDFTFKVFGHNGETVLVHDYVVIPSFLWKLKKIAKGIGKPEVFESGAFDRGDYVGESLTVTLDIEDNGEYEPKNRIKHYSALERQTSKKATATVGVSDGPHEAMDDDEIPFK